MITEILKTPLRRGGIPLRKMGILILQAIVPSAPFRVGVNRGMYVFIRDWSYRSLFNTMSFRVFFKKRSE